MTHLDERVNDQSTAYLTVSLFDKDDALADPTSATYDLYDEAGNIVNSRSGVPLSFSGGIVEITLTSDDNTLADPDNNTKELRRVLVHAIYGADDELHDDFVYWVYNLKK
jgi:hypothetical protein